MSRAARPREPMRMRRRLLLSYLTLATVALLALGVPLGILSGRAERRELALRAERDAVRVAAFVEEALQAGRPLAAAAAEGFVVEQARRTGGRIVVVDREGRSELVSDALGEPPRSFASRPEFAAALAGRVATGSRRSDTLDTDLLYVAVPVSSAGTVHGAVRITFTTSAVDARVRRTWGILAAIGLAVLGAATLLATRFARAISAPLARLEGAAARAGEGDLTVRAPLAGPREVRTLAESFNRTVGRLEELVGSQRAFVVDASHQLRTPLAALRLRLENLQERPTADGAATALVEVERLGRLVEGLLTLARADATVPDATTVDASAVVAERAEMWSTLAEERDVAISVSGPPAATAAGSADRLSQILDNLIENALAVSPEGAGIAIEVEQAGEAVLVRVRDQGPGLAPEEIARAFDRFWRGTANTGPGTGLGLAIARALARADGGDLTLAPAPTGGLAAQVRLRRAAAML